LARARSRVIPSTFTFEAQRDERRRPKGAGRRHPFACAFTLLDKA
jgi:hypothetical protein